MKNERRAFHLKAGYEHVVILVFFICILILTITFVVIPIAKDAWNNKETIIKPWIEMLAYGQEIRIDSWYDEQEEQLYFFLPKLIFSAGNRRVHMPENAELAIGKTRLRNGDALPELASGEEGFLKYNDGEGIEKGLDVVIMISSALPAVYIETESGSLDGVHQDSSHKETGSMLIMAANGRKDYQGVFEYIKGRGQSSLRYEKKAYTLRMPTATSLLNMGAGLSWVLCANVVDISGMKNHIVYETARKAGLPYSVEETFVDLYINNEYRGLYQMIEGIEVGESRVAIQDLAALTQAENSFELRKYPKMEEEKKMYFGIANNPADITGGYILEMDFPNRYMQEDSGMITRQNKHISFSAPQYASLEQVEYMVNIVDEAESAIFAADGISPATGKHFTEYIDLNSWVKKYLIDEIFMNFDAEASSAYFYKEAGDQRLYAGPVWDYDNSMCNETSPRDGRWIQSQNRKGFFASNPAAVNNEWYQNLYNQPAFYEALVIEFENTFLPLILEWSGGDLILAGMRYNIPVK